MNRGRSPLVTTLAALLALAAFALLSALLSALRAAEGASSNDAATRKPATPITVFAAASLTDVLEDAGAEFQRRSGVPVRHSFASSAQIARQLAAGAPADLFISADTEWMEYAVRRGLVRADTQRVLAGNALALIAPAASKITVDPTRLADWQAALGRGRLVIGDPDSVPLGRYAREALQFFGLWKSLEQRLARAENARAALALVARGEAALGIVYASDAKSERRVRVLANLDARAHAPIVYPAALVPASHPAASAYLDFLTSAESKELFIRHGFTEVSAPTDRSAQQ